MRTIYLELFDFLKKKNSCQQRVDLFSLLASGGRIFSTFGSPFNLHMRGPDLLRSGLRIYRQFIFCGSSPLFPSQLSFVVRIFFFQIYDITASILVHDVG